MNLTAIWKLLTDTFTEWNEDKPFQLAAALSYYTLFSLAPLLMIAIAVAGLVFGREASQQQIMSAMQGLVGSQGAQAIQTWIRRVAGRRIAGLVWLGDAAVCADLQSVAGCAHGMERCGDGRCHDGVAV